MRGRTLDLGLLFAALACLIKDRLLDVLEGPFKFARAIDVDAEGFNFSSGYSNLLELRRELLRELVRMRLMLITEACHDLRAPCESVGR